MNRNQDGMAADWLNATIEELCKDQKLGKRSDDLHLWSSLVRIPKA
jgi:hypothetical protein